MKYDTLKILSSEAPISNVGGALVQFLASEVPFQEKTLDVIIGILPPGVFVPLHSHSGAEWFFLLSGEMEAFIADETGGRWQLIVPDELIIVQAGIRHAWRNRSDIPVRILSFGGTSIFAVMRKLAVPANPAQAPAEPTAQFLQDLHLTAASTGNWIASPEENPAIGVKF